MIKKKKLSTIPDTENVGAKRSFDDMEDDKDVYSEGYNIYNASPRKWKIN